MASGTSVVWDEVFTAYDFGPTHPMAPVRLDLTTRLARPSACFDPTPRCCPRGRRRRRCWRPSTTATTSMPCTAASVDPTRSPTTPGPWHRRRPGLRRHARGLGPDRPGHPRHLPRGLAGRDRARRQLLRRPAPRDAHQASGFCIYNDVGVGIQWLLDHGAERVAYVDIDVHHGDGVERMFWNDPRVLTISVHETGRHLFPGTGWPMWGNGFHRY